MYESLLQSVWKRSKLKIEVKGPWKLTSFILFMTFCCRSAVASQWTSSSLPFYFLAFAFVATGLWVWQLPPTEAKETQKVTDWERGERKKVGLWDHKGRVTGENESGDVKQRGVRGKCVHTDEWGNWECVWGNKWKNEWDNITICVSRSWR